MANSLRGSVPAAVVLSALTDRRLIVDWPDVARNFDAVSGASLFPSREPRDDEWWRPKNATTAWQEPGGRPADAADDEEVRLDRLRAPGAARFVSVATRARTERQRSLCASWTRAWSRAPRDTAASPRRASSDYPRGTRGGGARRLHDISKRHPRRRRETLAEYSRGTGGGATIPSDNPGPDTGRDGRDSAPGLCVLESLCGRLAGRPPCM